MPFWIRVRWIVIPLLFLLLATSRPLAIKDLTGVAEAVPEGLSVVEEPIARFGENSNNQGCFADQVLDLRVRVHVRNDGGEEVTIREEDAEIFIDGVRKPLEPHTYTIGDGDPTVVPFEEYTLAPGDEKEVVVYSFGFMPREGFEEIDRIEVTLPVEDQEIRVLFDDVRSVEAEMR